MPLSAAQYPNLSGNNCEEKSPKSNHYNCIAWAVEDTNNWWWPSNPLVSTWPPDIPRENTVDAFIKMFESRGYVLCDSCVLERGYKKVALYALNGVPTHAARQLPSGKWTSKIGRNIDIENATPHGLEGPFYGEVVAKLKKQA